jgi:hypothetical protein
MAGCVARARPFLFAALVMASKTTIIQTAIARLGAEIPSSIAGDDDTVLAAVGLYDTIVLEFLCRHDWTFATKIQAMNKTATEVEPPWLAEYALPSGVTNIRDVRDSYGRQVEYDVIENVIYAMVTDDTLYIRHTWTPSEARWPGDFIGAVTEELLGQLLEVFEERARGEAVRKIALMKLVRAAARDSRQRPPQKFNASPMLRVWYNRRPARRYDNGN